MIKVDAIRLEYFRGAKQLALTIGGRNYAIAGANGTGKSAVVDAIEFALTGDITRLSGRGMGGVSLKQHGPHVDARDGLAEARVTLAARIAEAGTPFTITRSTKDPARCTVEPATPEALAAVAALEAHPEIALSRREILKYVIAEPGERAKAIQALLKLDALEKVRASFTSIANAAKKAAKDAKGRAEAAAASLRAALQVSELKSETVLVAVNARRAQAGLTPLIALTADTSIKEGVVGSSAQPLVNKALAQKEVEELAALVVPADVATFEAQCAEVDAAAENIRKSPSLLRALRGRAFLRSGLELVEADECPFCDQPWDRDHLRAHVSKKLEQAAEADALRTGLEAACAPVRAVAQDLVRRAGDVLGHAARVAPTVDVSPLRDWAGQLSGLVSVLGNVDDLLKCGAPIGHAWRSAPPAARGALSTITAAVTGLPDPNAADAARDYLSSGQERLGVYRTEAREAKRTNERGERAERVLATFNERCAAVLASIYSEVEQDFSRFYSLVHGEDEAAFHASLAPSKGKLDLDVEFYGRGLFPPAAYHSEGHQDSMGLCLYLALMKRLLGRSFTLAVLDDVLMSVDAGHRREVCRLLKQEFPETQFIITTHDRVWLQNMRVEGVIEPNSVVEFRSWSVEHGPQVWDDADAWTEIDEALSAGKVPQAAAALRRYLEFAMDDLSTRLRAAVERAPTYELGDLLPAVVGRWNRLLGQAKDAAQSWGKAEVMQAMKDRQTDFGVRYQASKAEQWAVNPTVHFNAWANLEAADFSRVVEAFHRLLDAFRCESCSAFVYISPSKGQADTIRCACGSIMINLKKRS